MTNSLLIALVSIVCAVTVACAAPPRVEVVETREGYQLLRDGKPYFIKGAGGKHNIELAAQCGANSVRTWGENEIDEAFLDRCHELGLTVCAGYWIGHPRHGFDYDDPEAVQQQLEDTVAWVNKWKHHPAILMWGVGNEVALTGGSEYLFKELDRIAKAVKEADPSRPTMSAISGVWPEKAGEFARLCPNIDIYGLNAYGGLTHASHTMINQGFTGPFVPTEFGPTGHWECGLTPWGAPIEQPTAGKVRTYRENYRMTVTDQPGRCLGSYAFLWGQKQEVTPTWYGMFLKTGEKLEPVDLMAELWSGKPPANRCPMVDGIDCDAASRYVAPGSTWSATALATEPDGDSMRYRWRVLEESTDRRHGGDEEAVPPEVAGAVEGAGATITLRAPSKPGPYRLFVIVDDGKNAAGAANIAFYVDADLKD